MKVCIKGEEFNPTLLAQNWCSEEKAIEMGYKVFEAPDNCSFEDFDETGFNNEKYLERIRVQEQANLNLAYKQEVINRVRQTYSVEDEIAILRQKQTKPEDFENYYNFVENIKKQVKNDLNFKN